MGLFVLSLNAQISDGQNSHVQHIKTENDVRLQDSRLPKGASQKSMKADRRNQNQYVEGQILVKLKSDVAMPRVEGQGNDNYLRAANASPLSEVFQQIGVKNMKPLPTPSKKKAETRSGRAVNSNIFKLTIDTTVISTEKAIEYLKKQDGVLIAEPNYIREQLGSSISGVSNPLFSQQWAINATNIQELWKVPTITDKRPVIAILDSGLDIDHEEFSGNLWVNEAELNGLPDVDDDGNGYVDDINGYSFVNHNNILNDHVGHGTHCAGIAAAKDNNKGIVGMNPDAKIMSLQLSNTYFVSNTEYIIEALSYAVDKGADVISLSLGGPKKSQIEMEAFAEASKYAVIVAAAGNSSYDTKDDISYPAGYPDVMGVQSADSTKSISYFSNTDENGPIFSDVTWNGLNPSNYELIAPGSNILSTLPAGYGIWSGTSMSAPCAAGIISRLLQCKEYHDRLTLKLDLINACKSGCIDAMKAYEGHKKSDFTASLFTIKYIDEYGYELIDGGVIPGSTVYAYPYLVNYGEDVDDIKITFSGVKNIGLSDSVITVSHINSGDTLKMGPVKMTIPDVIQTEEETDDFSNLFFIPKRDIVFNVTTQIHKDTASNYELYLDIYKEWDDHLFSMKDVKGHTTIIRGHVELEEDLYIPEGDTLIIKPNATVELKKEARLICDGKLICKGVKKHNIRFRGFNCGRITFKDTVEYVIFDDISFLEDGFKNCHFKTCSFGSIYNSSSVSLYDGLFAENCTFDHCSISLTAKHLFSNCKFENSRLTSLEQLDDSNEAAIYLPNMADMSSCNLYDNIYKNEDFSVAFFSDTAAILTPEKPSFLGSSNDSIVRQNIIDALNQTMPIGKGTVDISNKLDQLSPTAPPEIISANLNGVELKKYQNKWTNEAAHDLAHQDTFPEISTLKVVFSAPIDQKKSYFPHKLGVKWESDTVLITDVYLKDDYLNVEFYDNTGIFDGIRMVLTNFNIAENTQENKLKIECLSGGNMKLVWDSIVGFDDYDSINVYGMSFKAYLGSETEYSLLSQLPLDQTEIQLDTKHEYNGYCIKVKDVNGEETTIYTAFADCPYTDDDIIHEPIECETPDLNLETALIIMNQINKVDTLFYREEVDCFDLNADNTLNIQDFVYAYNSSTNDLDSCNSNKSAAYSIEDNILYVNSDCPITAIEAHFTTRENPTFETLSGLDSMEHFIHDMDNGEYLLMAFSFDNSKVPAGKQPLLKLPKRTVLKDILLTDQNGNAFDIYLNDCINLKNDYDSQMLKDPHYYDVFGHEISPSDINKGTGVYIQTYEIDGIRKGKLKYKTK